MSSAGEKTSFIVFEFWAVWTLGDGSILFLSKTVVCFKFTKITQKNEMITFKVQLKGKIQFETIKYYIVEVGLYVCIPSEKQSCSTVHMKAGYTQHVLFALRFSRLTSKHLTSWKSFSNLNCERSHLLGPGFLDPIAKLTIESSH
jgi:hypothetical protein